MENEAVNLCPRLLRPIGDADGDELYRGSFWAVVTRQRHRGKYTTSCDLEKRRSDLRKFSEDVFIVSSRRILSEPVF